MVDADIEDEMDAEEDEEDEEGVEEVEEEEEEEFTPSAWNATLAPHRSALRSPDKTLKSGVSSVMALSPLFFFFLKCSISIHKFLSVLLLLG